MKILMAGASGFIGKALRASLANHTIVRLVRSKNVPETYFWDPQTGELDPRAFEGVDAIINLAGENIATGRWTEARKRAILESRVRSTRLLAEAAAKHQLKLLINASATGYYGDRGNESLTETSSSGSGFLASVCRDWEAATEPAKTAGVRVANVRFGVVLSKEGGALKKMLLPFRLGVGGTIGSGEQVISWVALDDVTRVVNFILATPSLQGPINVVSPLPVTNREFTKTLGQVLHRPTLLPLPAFAVKLLFGEMGQEALLSSARVLPQQLEKAGFEFQYPHLKGALEQMLRS